MEKKKKNGERRESIRPKVAWPRGVPLDSRPYEYPRTARLLLARSPGDLLLGRADELRGAGPRCRAPHVSSRRGNLGEQLGRQRRGREPGGDCPRADDIAGKHGAVWATGWADNGRRAPRARADARAVVRVRGAPRWLF